MPEVSVIVPNYNHAPYLKQRLDSIFQQSYKNFEVILLDDASTDESVSVLQQYAQHPKVSHFIINETNTGSPFPQWKKGIALAKGKYIWIAETDDWAEPEFLETLIPLLEKEGMGLVFCNSNWVDQNGQIGESLTVPKESFERSGMEEITQQLLRKCTIQNVSAVVFKKQYLEQVSDYFMNFRACGDWILYVELLSKTNVQYTSKCLNNFRYYHDNISQKAAKAGVWITEGVHVLEVAKQIRLPVTIIFRTSGSWLWRLSKSDLSWQERLPVVKVVMRFFFQQVPWSLLSIQHSK